MASKLARLRIAGACGALIGAGALAVALAAPASAAVTGVSIDTPSGYGSTANNYGTGCTYTVSATYANANDGEVTFTAQNGTGTPETIGTVKPDSTSTTNKVSTTWTPKAQGSYTISASQATGAAKSTTAKVGGRGIQLPTIPLINSSLTGGSCLVLG